MKRTPRRRRLPNASDARSLLPLPLLLLPLLCLPRPSSNAVRVLRLLRRRALPLLRLPGPSQIPTAMKPWRARLLKRRQPAPLSALQPALPQRRLRLLHRHPRQQLRRRGVVRGPRQNRILSERGPAPGPVLVLVLARAQAPAPPQRMTPGRPRRSGTSAASCTSCSRAALGRAAVAVVAARRQRAALVAAAARLVATTTRRTRSALSCASVPRTVAALFM